MNINIITYKGVNFIIYNIFQSPTNYTVVFEMVSSLMFYRNTKKCESRIWSVGV